jgi:hypothetical protein
VLLRSVYLTRAVGPSLFFLLCCSTSLAPSFLHYPTRSFSTAIAGLDGEATRSTGSAWAWPCRRRRHRSWGMAAVALWWWISGLERSWWQLWQISGLRWRRRPWQISSLSMVCLPFLPLFFVGLDLAVQERRSPDPVVWRPDPGLGRASLGRGEAAVSRARSCERRQL